MKKKVNTVANGNGKKRNADEVRMNRLKYCVCFCLSARKGRRKKRKYHGGRKASALSLAKAVILK